MASNRARLAGVALLAAWMLAALGSCAPGVDAQPRCVRARVVFREDFETGDFSRWTSRTYNQGWGPESAACRDTRFAPEHPRSGRLSLRSRITCPSHTDVHRGYGGIQLDGSSVAPEFTNAGRGLVAPHGALTTFWAWLEAPRGFGGGRWVSLWTVNTDCAYAEEVVTLGLDSSARRLTPAHVAHTSFAPDAPAFPLGRWVRVSVYVNAARGELRVWQDGAPIASSTFARPTPRLCQWHWGLYASGDNDALTLYEDDIAVWRLDRDPIGPREPRVCR
jgi:hypothetical protein